MQFNSVQSGSFLTGAKSVAENATDIYNTAIQTGFNADQVIKQANANESVKKMASARRQASMANAGLTNFTNAKITEMDAKLKKDLKDIYRPAVRMEGVNRMAGSLAAGKYMMDEAKLQQKEQAELKLERQKINDAMIALSEAQAEQARTNAELDAARLKKLQEQSTSVVPGTSDSPGQTTSSTPVLPSSASSNSSNPSAKEVFDYMKSLGVSDIHAKGILANIKGESGFQTGVMGDGGKSGGLFQMYDDRYRKMVKNVPDWKTNWKGQIVHGLKDDVAPQYLKTNFGSAVEAADWFLHKYERPAQEHRPGREKLNQSFISSLPF
tara:strand:- start:5924 stop:6898 length:975 start_codon:yes stop_codon:yes gene_type:complete